MGLDITAYRKLAPAPDAKLDSDGYPVEWEKYFFAHKSSIDFAEREWPGRAEGVTAGVYAFAEAHGFRAGSYGGYNLWRDWLAYVAGWHGTRECWEADEAKARERPFYELLHFADNEGVIGPKVAAKLAKDFADNEARAEELANDDGWNIGRYREWRKAFEMAADGGAVDFH